MSKRSMAVTVLTSTFILGSLGACSPQNVPQGPPGTPSPSAGPAMPGPDTDTTSSGRFDLSALAAPMRVSETRWARGNLPRTVPEPGAPLPSLLDDLPGRALVASYVPRPSLSLDDEAVEFYGVDGRWRRLDIGDLDLPANDWSGSDTYGAGALSPDGRWWAGKMIDGMFLVDLRDGTTTLRQDVGGRSGSASFAWSPDSDELVLTLVGRATRVSVPDLALERFPRPDAYPGLLADGGWVECLNLRRVTTQCDAYGADGTLMQERLLPTDLQEKWAGPIFGSLDEGDSVFYSLLGSPYGNYRNDSEVLRTDGDFVADARLVLPKGSEVNAIGRSFNRNVLGLAAYNNRLHLAWLVDKQEVVKVIQPGIGLVGGTGQDFWDISYASDLVQIR